MFILRNNIFVFTFYSRYYPLNIVLRLSKFSPYTSRFLHENRYNFIKNATSDIYFSMNAIFFHFESIDKMLLTGRRKYCERMYIFWAKKNRRPSKLPWSRLHQIRNDVYRKHLIVFLIFQVNRLHITLKARLKIGGSIYGGCVMILKFRFNLFWKQTADTSFSAQSLYLLQGNSETR